MTERADWSGKKWIGENSVCVCVCVWGGSNNGNRGGWSLQEEVPSESPGSEANQLEEEAESGGVRARANVFFFCFREASA